MPPSVLTQDQTDAQEFMVGLYEQYRRLMFSTARKYTADPQESEEIVQDALVKLVENVDTMRRVERCVLPAMIVIIVRNTAINHLKHMNVVRRHRAELPEEQDEPSGGPSMDELMVREEQLDALRRVWPRLSEADQLLLSGRYILGLDDRELARLAGCKPGSVRMKLTRARRNALREMKKERCIDDESEQTDN